MRREGPMRLRDAEEDDSLHPRRRLPFALAQRPCMGRPSEGCARVRRETIVEHRPPPRNRGPRLDLPDGPPGRGRKHFAGAVPQGRGTGARRSLRNSSGNPPRTKNPVARAVIEWAERDGRLEPGDTMVGYAAGSTGTSLALVCAENYRIRIVTADAFSSENPGHVPVSSDSGQRWSRSEASGGA